MVTVSSTATSRWMSPAARSLWAKSGDDTGWLNLPQHMLDSAGVAERLWDEWTAGSVRETIARLTGLDDAGARTVFTWLACVHDVGKAQLRFQLQLDQRPGFEAFARRLRDAGLPLRMSAVERNLEALPHGLASGILVRDWLVREGVKPRVAQSLADIVDSHHGIPSRIAIRGRAAAVLRAYPGEWKAVHDELLTMAADATHVRELLPHLTARISGPAQNLLTGLVIMADWIASNADAFPMIVDERQQDRLDRGLESIDLTPPWQPDPSTPGAITAFMQHRFSWSAGRTPRPVQQVVVEACAGITGPGLVIIEAPTGEGKTEAALAAAEYLAATSGAGGVIVAAPTMATANGLFERVLGWANRATQTGDVTSMFLGHSKSMLSAPYRSLRYRDIGEDLHERGVVVASQWMSGRKKGILSTFTVATVDQVLFMALQAKHSMLRHLGLAGKVVIIDEVHAYDAYMSEYLHKALMWLARYRVSIILLSATLPVEQKRALINAYGGQLDRTAPEKLSSAYPLITTVSEQEISERPVAPRPADLTAQVSLLEDGIDALVTSLREQTVQGGCVLIICNTIRRAQEAYECLVTQFPGAVELHHAAFIASDRAQKEDALRAQLGPDTHRGGERPQLRFIVATQVAEQSLDIDVDLLVTDIAPMDLIIQRIGRLHRHVRPDIDRPERLRTPHVLIRGLASLAPTPQFDDGTAFVYDPRLLLSTLATLLDGPVGSGLTRPDDVARLVQTAYGSAPPIPDAWSDAWDRATAESDANRERARRRAQGYLFPDPGRANSLDAQFAAQDREIGTPAGEAAGLAQVRDSDPTLEVIPIVRTEGGYAPLPWIGADDAELIADRAPSSPVALTLAGSTVRLPARFGRDYEQFDAIVSELERATPTGWNQSHLLKGALALPLDEALTVELAGRTLVYDRDLGLQDRTTNVKPRP